MDSKFCQSCGMPMAADGEMYGSNEDGSKNEDYCKYCFENGSFSSESTMEEMIESCIPFTVEGGEMTEEEARKMMQEFFPTLKRWKLA